MEIVVPAGFAREQRIGGSHVSLDKRVSTSVDHRDAVSGLNRGFYRPDSPQVKADNTLSFSFKEVCCEQCGEGASFKERPGFIKEKASVCIGIPGHCQVCAGLADGLRRHATIFRAQQVWTAHGYAGEGAIRLSKEPLAALNRCF